MVIGQVNLDGGIGNAIISLLPVQGLYSTPLGAFLAVLVGIRLILYLFTATVEANNIRKIGNVPMYLLTAVYFGWFVLFFVLVFHLFKQWVYQIKKKENVVEQDRFPEFHSNFD